MTLVLGMAYISASPIGSLWRRSPSFAESARCNVSLFDRRRHENHSLGDRLLVGGTPRSGETARNDLQGEGSQHDAKDGGDAPSTAEAVGLRTPPQCRGTAHQLLHIQTAEGAKLWASVLTEIKNRGVEDVCFTVCYGLKDLPEATNVPFL